MRKWLATVPTGVAGPGQNRFGVGLNSGGASEGRRSSNIPVDVGTTVHS